MMEPRLHVNVKATEQSKQWVLTLLANKPKKFKQTVSARKLISAVSWHRTGKEC
jgi:hypothetical protein